MTTIGLLNYATTSLPFTLPQLQAALQEYTALLGPVWGVECAVVLCDDVPSAASGIWPLFLADTSNESGAVAYHTLASTNQPWGVAFVKTALDNGDDPCVAVSHEFAEMLVDPDCDSSAIGVGGLFYAMEICDPVQQLWFPASNGLLLADFVYPAWFGLPNRDGSARLDQMRSCTTTRQILPGGYASIWSAAAGWVNQVADSLGAAAMIRKFGTTKSRLSRVRQEKTPW